MSLAPDVEAAPFGRRRGVVMTHRKVGAYVLMQVSDRRGPAPRPGQFYMLSTVRGWGAGEDERPFLPRAFSVMGGGDGTLWFMFEDVGPGTHQLAGLHKADALWVTGPLGRPFRAPEEGRRPVLVAGGIGVPPIVFLSREVPPSALIVGFRDAAHAEVAATMAGAQVCTDDGSVGHRGYVTGPLAAELDRDPHAQVYACGPPGMLEAVRQLVVERDVPAQLALESGMACGYGACYGCVVPLAAGGYARVCVDGPVLDATEVLQVPAH